MKKTTEPVSPCSVTKEDLLDAYGGLEQDQFGRLSGGRGYLFAQKDHEPSVSLPTTLSYIVHDGSVYFLIPADLQDLPEFWKTSQWLERDPANDGEYFIPAEADDLLCTDFNSEKIIDAINEYLAAVHEVWDDRAYRETLDRERNRFSGLYASASEVEPETPMLVEGLMRERGVSVFYGDFDEFKTTLVLDLAAHIATGAPWQGRKVSPRPVIWYALEGAEEIPVRLRALEARLRDKDTPWGDDRAPVTVLDRIPENYADWRKEIVEFMRRWEKLASARWETGELVFQDGPGDEDKNYPNPYGDDEDLEPVVVIDTLSMALGGDDEKGPRAVGFIQDCLDLLKQRPDMESDYLGGALAWPVASHIIVIHHQTKTGTEFAGHRAIGANTQGLYRVHRFGKMADAERPFAGQLTPQRVKGIPRPAPFRFEVEVVAVEGTRQTAAILKDKAAAVPKDLAPIIDALAALADHQEITPGDLNACLDVVAAKGSRDGHAKRKARQRYREKLEAAGVIEPVEDDNGRVTFYRFHGSR